jgi:queuine tRNA-ribosyltransferase
MAFDECVEIPSPRSYVEQSCDRTYRWLVRCKEAIGRQGYGSGTGGQVRCPASPAITQGDGSLVFTAPDLFGINQGAAFEDLRIAHMKRIAELDLPGYAIGGLAVGETTQQMYDIIDAVEEHMPSNKPRYLMGVGTPQNIVECVARGVDFFDCVMPARNGRHGKLYTWSGSGHINILNEQYKEDSSPIDTECDCPVCQKFSRAYIRHLFKAGEMLAMRLAVLHNLYYYNTLMQKIRDSLDDGTFEMIRKRINDTN